MAEPVFTVSQVNNYLKHLLSTDAALMTLNVEGEVADYKVSGRHAYFTLKDAGAELRCTRFGCADNPYHPKNGDKVIVSGRVDFYIPRGQVSLNAVRMRPAGLGDLYQKFLETKSKLEKLGYFEARHKKPIPRYPRRIGVVTSEKGAVIRDIINVARRRNRTVDIVLYPARVQGEGAEREVMAGIDYFNEKSDVDTIIVARGGGSLEDMAPFNTEVLALKVFDSVKPVISAVGHETDFSLADFVADLRAPTPSAAAELAVPDASQMAGNLKYYCEKLYASCTRAFVEGRRNFKAQAEAVALKTKSVLDLSAARIRERTNRMSSLAEGKVMAGEALATAALTAIGKRSEQVFTEKENAFRLFVSKLNALNPLSLLEKGYAKVSRKGKEIASVADVAEGDAISVRLSDGEIRAKVTETREIKKHKEQTYGI